MEQDKKFPLDAKEYKLYEEVGEGVSASVYRALCVPLNEIVAIKVLDLEKCNNDLDGIRREVHTMTLISHQNLLRAHCSFTAGHSLWVVMPYMAGGSCLHIMKSSFPEGFEEPVIATLLHEVLKALVYLHAHGHIHRDVKAGNILIDSNGAVKLADFGVSACMFDTGDRQRSRNTFVGTPCWMAPEVMQQLHGYDFKADIWSFGITALELAHGHAPFSKYPPMKVLLMTLQNAPPGLDYERDKRFSKSFKELVAACLVKDPKKRPTSEKLLKHHFFKHARPVEYLSRTILDGLSPLGDRFRTLKAKEADLLVQNKALYGDKEHLSQQEYIRGISAWNFNLEDLKNQAALIQDDGTPHEGNKEQSDSYEDVNFPAERSTIEMENQSNAASNEEDGFDDLHDLDGSLASFPIKPLQALKGCFDVFEEEVSATSPTTIVHENGRSGGETSGKSSYLPRHDIPGPKKFMSGSLLPDNVPSKKVIGEGERDHLQSKHQPERNYSGPLLYRQKRDANNPTSAEDMSEGAVVQHKGRFKVTPVDLSPKGSSNSFFNPSGGSTSPPTSNVQAVSILSALQDMLLQNTSQREELIKLLGYPDEMCMIGVVGTVSVFNELRLVEVPDMGYDPLGDPSCGEICVRGKTVFAGYHKSPELTREAIKDGWFHTGDIGQILPNGSIKIIDRKKNLIKLSQGEYVALEYLENVYGISSVIDDIWVYGNSFKSKLVAVVVPEENSTKKWADLNGHTGSFSDLCSLDQLKNYILEELKLTAERNKMRGFEYIKGIIIEPRPFDMERDLVTATLKKKRNQLLKYYQVGLDELYQNLDAGRKY